uniref:Uncharacterized protein n=1 Tax=viral metagenome TaxID=1070528 RepID=A0A6H1ZZK1_9ZZZZ
MERYNDIFFREDLRGYMRKLFIFLIGVGIAFPLYIYLGQIYSLGFLLAYFLYTALRDI